MNRLVRRFLVDQPAIIFLTISVFEGSNHFAVFFRYEIPTFKFAPDKYCKCWRQNTSDGKATHVIFDSICPAAIHTNQPIRF